jgi:hypothetical protein
MEATAMNDTNVKDYKQGKKDRMCGYYDKWYRYNRKDDGAAYDDGVKAAIDSGKAKDDVIIIECRVEIN